MIDPCAIPNGAAQRAVFHTRGRKTLTQKLDYCSPTSCVIAQREQESNLNGIAAAVCQATGTKLAAHDPVGAPLRTPLMARAASISKPAPAYAGLTPGADLTA